MKFTVGREATVREIEAGEAFTRDGKRWITDEIHFSRDGAKILCTAEGETSTVSRRKTFEVKSGEKITIEPGPEDGAKIVSELVRMMVEGDEKHTFKRGADGWVSFEIATAPDRAWTVTIEP